MLEDSDNVSLPNTDVKYHSFPPNLSTLSYRSILFGTYSRLATMFTAPLSYSNFESIIVKLTFYYISGNMLIQSLSFVQQS